jgi:hypothetical protein
MSAQVISTVQASLKLAPRFARKIFRHRENMGIGEHGTIHLHQKSGTDRERIEKPPFALQSCEARLSIPMKIW